MKIEIEKFKAFNNEITIDTQNKNFVLYGENGAGKSSIYEALRVVFFKNRLEQEIPTANTPEDQEAYNQDFWNKYNNQITNDNFVLKVNDTNYLNFDTSSYQVFMVSLSELKERDNLQLTELLDRYFFDISHIDEFCANNYSSLQSKVNQSLNEFNENITITIDNEDDFKIKIKDNQRNFERKVEIKRFFNEAKLNIVTLLLLFHSIILSEKEEDKIKLLILDDFITSLDVSNRTYILKFLFDNFSDFKLMIFTHNINFYNLILYFVKEIYKKRDYKFANLYEINGSNKIFYKDEIDTVRKIRKKYKSDTTQLETIGNRIRQKFERLLYELSKALMVGSVEESKKIIERIADGKSIYFQNKKDANDLVDEIDRIINLENPQDLQNSLQRKVNKYKSEEFQQLKQIIQDLKIYRKVTMNQMSHATDYGMTQFTTTEIERTLELLEKLEQIIKQIIS